MNKLDEFRTQYPQYSDVPDQQLADAIHAKFYSDVPLDKYYSALGLSLGAIDDPVLDEETSFTGALQEAGKRALGGSYTGFVDLFGGIGQLLPGVDDQSMVDMSRRAQARTAEALDYDPAYSEDFITEEGFDADRFVAQLGGVIGNMAPQVLSLAIPGARKQTLSRFATYIGQSVSEGGFERPEDLTTFQRLADKGGDIGLALLEPLGLERVIKGVPKGFFQSPAGNPFLRRIESMFRSGVAEGIQETAQGIARDLKALAIYDPDREIADSALEDFTLGGGAGAFFDFAISTVMGGNRRTPKVDAPKEISEPTEDQIADEQAAREEKLTQEQARVTEKDAELQQEQAGLEPPARPDRTSSVAIDPDLEVEEMVAEIKRRDNLIGGVDLEVQGRDGLYTVTQNGRQFGPAMQDPIKAQEVKARLSEESDNLRVDEVINAHIIETGGRGPNPDIRVLRSLAKKGFIEQSVVDEEARRQKQDRKTRVFEEAGERALGRMAAEGRVDQKTVDSLMRGKIKRFYQSIRDAGRRFTPEEPTKPRIKAGRTTAEPAPVINLLERRIDTALNRKGIGNRLNSKEGSGVVQTIVGRPVSESNPLNDLTRSEMEYVLQTIEQAPQVATPRVTGVDQVDPVTGVTVPGRPRMIGPQAAVFIPNFADIGQPAQPEVRTEPIEAVEKGKEIVPFDPKAEEKIADTQIESAVNKQVQDILASVGIDKDYAAKVVKQVGTARRDSEGNVYIEDQANVPMGEIKTMGSAQAGAKVIQVALDGVKQRVDQGMSFEEAVAAVMNHETVHGLRAMDLFTAKEFSLLERLSRQYGKPGTNQTYAQWAVSTYSTRTDPVTGQEVPQSAVIQQEEAIAEMLSDALTKGVLIDGNLRKIGGKPRTLIQRIVNLFKRLVGYAKDNDIQSYRELVNSIQSGEVGGRERGVVRTLMQTEKNIGEVEDRGVTTEELQLVTGTRPTQETIKQIAEGVKKQNEQMIADNPDLDPDIGRVVKDIPDEVLESRIARAVEQDFNVNETYYHASQSNDIKKFQAEVGMGVVAGHFSQDTDLVNLFAQERVSPLDPSVRIGNPTVYMVFLRNFGVDNSPLTERRSLYAHRDEGASQANRLMAEIMEDDLSSHPELEADLVSFFARQLDQFLIDPKPNPVLDAVASVSKLSKLAPLPMAKAKLFSQEAKDLAQAYEFEINKFGESPATRLEYARRLAEVFHRNDAPSSLKVVEENPYDVAFSELEPLAPYMKEAGFAGYRDVEEIDGPYSAIAVFDPADVKGVAANFDPSAVPEGRLYADDIMYSKEDKKHGIPRDYIVTSRGKVRGKSAFPKAMNPQNSEKQIKNLKEIAKRHPDPLSSKAAWLKFERDLVGENETPPAPTGLISLYEDMDKWVERHSFLTPEQTEAAAEGFEAVQELSSAYDSGDATVDTTGKLMLWGILSRQLSAYPHESAFLDAATSPRLSEFIKRAVDRPWTQKDIDDYLQWAGSIIPDFAPGKSGTSNLNDFGKVFLAKMSRRTPDGRSQLEELHDLISDKSIPTIDVRARFYGLADKPGIQNKVLSFALLMSGRNDVVILDRIQINSMWEAGKYGKLIYNDVVSLFNEAHGLARYEALERSLSNKIKELYRRMGRPEDASVGRYHWESWVRDSGQVVAHPTIKGLVRELKQDKELAESYANLGAREGRFHEFASSSVYARDENGKPHVLYPDSKGNVHKFGLKDFNAFLTEVKDPKNGVIPRGFSVKSHYNAGIPWYESEAVNLEKLDGLIDNFSQGKVTTRQSLSDAIPATDPDGPRGQLTERRAEREEAQESRASIRPIDPVQLEKVVQQNQQEANEAGATVPLYSVKASPEAQYIARNPDSAIVPDEILEARDPQYKPQTRSFIDRLVADKPERVDPMQEYMDATGDNSSFEYKKTKARQAIFNRYARLEKLNQKYFKDYLADSSSIAAVLFADRAVGVTAEAFKSGSVQYKDGLTKVVDFEHNGKKYRGLIDIMDLLRTKKHGDLTQFAQAYAIAMRGKRLNDDGKVTPVTEADYEQAMQDVQQFTDDEGNNPVIEWYGAWQAFNNKMIEFGQDTGVLNKKTAEQWRLASDYIPYYRALDPDAQIGKVVTNTYGDLRKLGAFKPYKGKTDKINVPLVEAVTKNVASMIDLGMRNVAQQRIARDMQKLQLATQVPASRQGEAGGIGVKVKGEPGLFQLHDPLILESMTAIDSSGLENISRTYFGPFSALLRETVTRTPGFMIANLIRDSLSAFVTSGARFLPWISTAKGYFDDVNRLERTGVVGGYDFQFGRIRDASITDLFAEESANRNRRGLPLNMFKSMWRFAGRQTTRSDAATRQAVFNDVYSRTGNEAEAHYQAMEVLNFARRGSNGTVRAITAAIPFLNARIQGLDVLYRGAIGVNPAQRDLTQNRAIVGFALRGAILATATAMYWAMNSDEEEYREVSREIRDNNWLFPVPWLKDVGYIAIPIPFEVGLIFKTIPEVVLDTTFTYSEDEGLDLGGQRTGRQAYQSVKQAFLTTFEVNPVYGVQAIAPVLESITNYNAYTGRPIVPIYMTGQRPELQRSDSTSELAILLQNLTVPFSDGGISPMKIDHIIKGYTGGTGVFVSTWVDRVVRSESSAELLDNIGYDVRQEPMSALATYDYPIVKRFLTSPEGTGLKEQFYDLYNEVRQDYNSMNALYRDGRMDELDALIPKIGYLQDVKAQVYNIKKELDNVRVMRRGIMRSDIEADMKKNELERLREYENGILKITPILERMAQRPVIRGM